MKKEKLTCCLCNCEIKEDITGYAFGHNAQPLVDGRCCEGCNSAKVLPIRIIQMIDPEKANEQIKYFQETRSAMLN